MKNKSSAKFGLPVVQHAVAEFFSEWNVSYHADLKRQREGEKKQKRRTKKEEKEKKERY